MRKFILLCLLGFSGVLFGQNLGTDRGVGLQGFAVNGNGTMWLKGATIDNTIEGSTYLFPGWEGLYQMFIDDKQYYSIKNLNYNINSKSLESKFSQDSVFQFDIKKINFIKRGEEKYKYYTVNSSPELCQEFYASSKIIFIKNFKLDLINGVLNPLTQEKTKSKYVKKEKFFCKTSDKEFTEIDLKKKPILKLLGDKSKLVEKYASGSKLSFSTEKDLCKIFQYYDSL